MPVKLIKRGRPKKSPLSKSEKISRASHRDGIRSSMESLGITQGAAATRCRVSRSMVSRWLGGRVESKGLGEKLTALVARMEKKVK